MSETGALHLVSGGLDRAADRRTDSSWLQAVLAGGETRVMWVSHGAVAVAEHAHAIGLLLAPAPEAMSESGVGEVDLSFLGLDADGRAFFALHAVELHAELTGEAVRWMTLRELGLRLPGEQATMAVTAVALDNWRRRTRRCPSCGDDLVPRDAGWALHCAAEQAEHFPRTDPAVIVLVRDGQDRALLGRHANWEPGWMSTIAGFVEAGESAEAAVRREVREETGVRIGEGGDHLTYLGSQPWPFPSSLMLGYHARAVSLDVRVDGIEIGAARWFSRSELHDACAEGSVRVPPPLSIARRLIERWYGEPLPGSWERR